MLLKYVVENLKLRGKSLLLSIKSLEFSTLRSNYRCSRAKT